MPAKIATTEAWDGHGNIIKILIEDFEYNSGGAIISRTPRNLVAEPGVVDKVVLVLGDTVIDSSLVPGDAVDFTTEGAYGIVIVKYGLLDISPGYYTNGTIVTYTSQTKNGVVEADNLRIHLKEGVT